MAGKKLREIFNEGKLYQESEGKMYSAHLEPSSTPAEIANDLGVHYSTVSKAIKVYRKELEMIKFKNRNLT